MGSDLGRDHALKHTPIQCEIDNEAVLASCGTPTAPRLLDFEPLARWPLAGFPYVAEIKQTCNFTWYALSQLEPPRSSP
jgi:hypothetical protein